MLLYVYYYAYVTSKNNVSITNTFFVLTLSLTIQQIAQQKALSIGFVPNQGVENLLAARAKQSDKDILEIETVDDSLGLFEKLTFTEQALLLENTLDDADNMIVLLEALVSNWLKGEYQEMYNISVTPEPDASEQEKAILVKYNKLLLDDRNFKMADRLEAYLADPQVTFAVVGALHLGGENGLIQLMQNRGYQLARLNVGGGLLNP